MKSIRVLLSFFLLLGGFSLFNQAASAASYGGKDKDALRLDLAEGFQQVEINRTVDLTVNEGKLLTLTEKAAKILLANPDIASFQAPSQNSVFVFAKRFGKTTLYALDENDKVILAVNLRVGYNLDKVSQYVNAEVPGAKIKLGPLTQGGLIVKGMVKTPQQAKAVISSLESYLGIDSSAAGGPPRGQGGGPALRIVNQMKVELSAQINISVRIVEVSRTLSRSLGFSWDALFDNNQSFFRNGSSLFDASSGAFTGGDVTNAVLGSSSSNLGGVLSALSSDGMASILAEPNLTAMSGETAGFAAGGEVPIVIVSNNNVSIEYKQYGVIMRMTPTLLSPNRISLHIAPEVSDLSDVGSVNLSGNIIPAFKVRRADTTVELASGQSFALGGMLRSSINQTITGVPGLRNIPGLGRLFESEVNEKEETELVIIATAYVVAPTSPNDLQTPGEGIQALDATLPSMASAGYLY
ncbi:type II and III secretion system protein family protein [Marinomonas transparens]|uniref:Type II and III secretion system protein family protein n=1 Tax=Marinomonas transparens TaxID=2795388 RepID=A0A934JHJ2_9GAMM|nr:type II and III secretion system protein family protein [Marinomonas transparens]MBJ7536145.1 type II and III secretion system protein family protein [Marinomonas transparens]